MSANKYARGFAAVPPGMNARVIGADASTDPPLLSEVSLHVQSSSHESGVQWRAVFKQNGKPDHCTEWTDRVRFNADWAVIRNMLPKAVAAHSGRPH